MSDLVASAFSNADLSVEIAKAEPIVLRSPCPVPVRTSFGTMHDRPALFLRLEDRNGHVGLGEVWCNFPACGAEHRARFLETAILPALIDRRFDDPAKGFTALSQQFERLAIQSGEPGPIAQCLAGIDLALWDLVARRLETPLHGLLGSKDDRIRSYASGINPDQAGRTVERCRTEGYTAFKLKIGFDKDTDLGNLRNICSGLIEGERLMVDANQAWMPSEAAIRAGELAAYPLDWLEEPMLATTAPLAWQNLAHTSPIPLAGGENLIGGPAFDEVLDGDWLAVVQPDLCKWGGISGALPVARRIIDAGKHFCPHFLGGGIGLAASAHLLAAAGGDGLLEIDSNRNPLREDLYSPDVKAGWLTMPSNPGLGIEVEAFDAFVSNHSGTAGTSVKGTVEPAR